LPPVGESTIEKVRKGDLELEAIFKELDKKIEKQAKSLKCPRCGGDVRYSDLLFGKKPRQRKRPRPSQPPGSDLRELLDKLVLLQKRIDETDITDADKLAIYLRRNEAIRDKIIEYLFWSPGQMVYYDNKDRLIDAKSALQEVWQDISRNLIWDRIDSQGWDYTLIVDEYMRRAIVIGPTLISRHPRSKFFHRYFQSAVLCWIYGIFEASLIFCCTAIEDILKMLLEKHGEQLINSDGKPLMLGGLIQKAEQLITGSEKSTLDKMNQMRRNSIHRMKVTLSEEESLTVLKDTIGFVNKYLS